MCNLTYEREDEKNDTTSYPFTTVEDETCRACYEKTRTDVNCGLIMMPTEVKELWYNYYRNDGKPFVKCCLCKEKFPESWGNNPWPLAQNGSCCMQCNSTKVWKARIGLRFLMEESNEESDEESVRRRVRRRRGGEGLMNLPRDVMWL